MEKTLSKVQLALGAICFIVAVVAMVAAPFKGRFDLFIAGVLFWELGKAVVSSDKKKEVSK